MGFLIKFGLTIHSRVFLFNLYFLYVLYYMSKQIIFLLVTIYIMITVESILFAYLYENSKKFKICFKFFLG